MFSDPMAMRVMANKYRRLAEQQTDLKEREKYGTYACIYSGIALGFELHHKLAGLAATPTTNLARKQAQSDD